MLRPLSAVSKTVVVVDYKPKRSDLLPGSPSVFLADHSRESETTSTARVAIGVSQQTPKRGASTPLSPTQSCERAPCGSSNDAGNAAAEKESKNNSKTYNQTADCASNIMLYKYAEGCIFMPCRN